VNFFVFLGPSGYLFGDEYFEVVLLRRLDRTATPAAYRCDDLRRVEPDLLAS